MKDELSLFVEDERKRRDMYEKCISKTAKDFNITVEECEEILKTFNTKSSKLYEVMNILDKDVRHSVKHFPATKKNLVNNLEGIEIPKNPKTKQEKELFELYKLSRTFNLGDYTDYPIFISIIMSIIVECVIKKYRVITARYKKIVVKETDDEEPESENSTTPIYTKNFDDIILELGLYDNYATYTCQDVIEEDTERFITDKTMDLFLSIFNQNDYFTFGSIEYLHNLVDKNSFDPMFYRGRIVRESLIPVLETYKFKKDHAYSLDELAEIIFKMKHYRFSAQVCGYHYEHLNAVIYDYPSYNRSKSSDESIPIDKIDEKLTFNEYSDDQDEIAYDANISNIYFNSESDKKNKKYSKNLLIQFVFGS